METSTYPPVSVIIPARNEANSIGKTLDAIVGQDYPETIEIIVADGSEGNETSRVASAYPVNLIANPGRIVSTGLNLGISASSHGIIVRCDAHAILPPSYVRQAVDTMRRTGATIVGGMQVPIGTKLFQRAVASAMSSVCGAGDSKQKIGGPDGPADMVYLGVFDKQALVEIGGFNERINQNQDYELAWRIRKSGGTVWFDPKLRVEYQPRQSISSLAKQYFNYGRWKAVVLVNHPRSLRMRQIAAPLLVVGMLAWLIGLLADFTSLWALYPVLPLGYPLMLMLCSVSAWLRRNRDVAVLLMPVALATMHLSWGGGFLFSLISFLPFRSGKSEIPEISKQIDR